MSLRDSEQQLGWTTQFSPEAGTFVLQNSILGITTTTDRPPQPVGPYGTEWEVEHLRDGSTQYYSHVDDFYTKIEPPGPDELMPEPLPDGWQHMQIFAPNRQIIEYFQNESQGRIQWNRPDVVPRFVPPAPAPAQPSPRRRVQTPRQAVPPPREPTPGRFSSASPFLEPPAPAPVEQSPRKRGRTPSTSTVVNRARQTLDSWQHLGEDELEEQHQGWLNSDAPLADGWDNWPPDFVLFYDRWKRIDGNAQMGAYIGEYLIRQREDGLYPEVDEWLQETVQLVRDEWDYNERVAVYGRDGLRDKTIPPSYGKKLGFTFDGKWFMFVGGKKDMDWNEDLLLSAAEATLKNNVDPETWMQSRFGQPRLPDGGQQEAGVRHNNHPALYRWVNARNVQANSAASQRGDPRNSASKTWNRASKPDAGELAIKGPREAVRNNHWWGTFVDDSPIRRDERRIDGETRIHHARDNMRIVYRAPLRGTTTEDQRRAVQCHTYFWNTDPTYVQQFQAEARRVHAENNIRRKQALDYRNSEAARVAESRNAGQHAKQAIRVFPPLPFKPPPVNDTDLFEVTIGGPASEQTAQIERQDMNVDPVDSDLEYDGEVEKKSCTQCRWDNEYTRCSSLKSGIYPCDRCKVTQIPAKNRREIEPPFCQPGGDQGTQRRATDLMGPYLISFWAKDLVKLPKRPGPFDNDGEDDDADEYARARQSASQAPPPRPAAVQSVFRAGPRAGTDNPLLRSGRPAKARPAQGRPAQERSNDNRPPLRVDRWRPPAGPPGRKQSKRRSRSPSRHRRSGLRSRSPLRRKRCIRCTRLELECDGLWECDQCQAVAKDWDEISDGESDDSLFGGSEACAYEGGYTMEDKKMAVAAKSSLANAAKGKQDQSRRISISPAHNRKTAPRAPSPVRLQCCIPCTELDLECDGLWSCNQCDAAAVDLGLDEGWDSDGPEGPICEYEGGYKPPTNNTYTGAAPPGLPNASSTSPEEKRCIRCMQYQKSCDGREPCDPCLKQLVICKYDTPKTVYGEQVDQYDFSAAKQHSPAMAARCSAQARRASRVVRDDPTVDTADTTGDVFDTDGLNPTENEEGTMSELLGFGKVDINTNEPWDIIELNERPPFTRTKDPCTESLTFWLPSSPSQTCNSTPCGRCQHLFDVSSRACLPCHRLQTTTAPTTFHEETIRALTKHPYCRPCRLTLQSTALEASPGRTSWNYRTLHCRCFVKLQKTHICNAHRVEVGRRIQEEALRRMQEALGDVRSLYCAECGERPGEEEGRAWRCRLCLLPVLG